MVMGNPEREPDLVLKGPAGVGPKVAGEALVSQHGFSARYDLDRERGLFSREAHDLHGQSLVDRVVVFPTAKGGIASPSRGAYHATSTVPSKTEPARTELLRAKRRSL